MLVLLAARNLYGHTVIALTCTSRTPWLWSTSVRDPMKIALLLYSNPPPPRPSWNILQHSSDLVSGVTGDKWSKYRKIEVTDNFTAYKNIEWPPRRHDSWPSTFWLRLIASCMHFVLENRVTANISCSATSIRRRQRFRSVPYRGRRWLATRSSSPLQALK